MITRRRVLVGLGAGVGALAVGCGANRGSGSDGAAPPDAAGSDTVPPDATADAAANACTATSSLTPEELLAHIETIVVVCMENRPFDHYLGSLALVEGRADVAGLTGTESNPTVDGLPVLVHPLDDLTPNDPPHGWGPCHSQWNFGANDGFVRVHAGASQADVMGYYVRAQIPVTYALADAGVVCNAWHAACLGPTYPNRCYLHGATSHGVKTDVPVLGLVSIFDRLAAAGIAATNYFSDFAWATAGYLKLTGLATIEQFFSDAAAGMLPPFSIVDPQFTGAGANDDHPDHDIRLGQAFLASVVAALGQSPQWNRCLIVVTYDEHGGF